MIWKLILLILCSHVWGISFGVSQKVELGTQGSGCVVRQIISPVCTQPNLSQTLSMHVVTDCQEEASTAAARLLHASTLSRVPFLLFRRISLFRLQALSDNCTK